MSEKPLAQRLGDLENKLRRKAGRINKQARREGESGIVESMEVLEEVEILARAREIAKREAC